MILREIWKRREVPTELQYFIIAGLAKKPPCVLLGLICASKCGKREVGEDCPDRLYFK